MKITNPVAKLGEDLACKLLKSKGYKILERNFRKGYGELDIITQLDNLLVFVEVKTRTVERFGTPFESITPWKLKSLIKTGIFYKSLHPNLPEALRMDAVSVILDKDNKLKNIEHIENISY